jgi:hypothetical protein
MPIAQPKPVFDDVAPWPEKPKPALAAVGHNKPPVEDEARAAFREALLADRPDFEQKVEDIVAAADRARVIDDETYARGGSFVKTARAAIAHVGAAHTAAKAPYLAGGRVVDAQKNELVFRIEQARDKVQQQLNAYAAQKEAEARAERERIAAEQRAAAEAAMKAERERQEAEAAAARAAREAASEEERAAAAERAAEAARQAEAAMAQLRSRPPRSPRPSRSVRMTAPPCPARRSGTARSTTMPRPSRPSRPTRRSRRPSRPPSRAASVLVIEKFPAPASGPPSRPSRADPIQSPENT